MTWQWRATVDEADEPTAVSEGFVSQELAESWLTGAYEELLDDGYSSVWLYDDERLVYGPMPLNA